MKSFPGVTIIVLNYNGLDALGEHLSICLESVLKTDYPSFEIVFADNGSTDGSPELIERLCVADARLRVVRFNMNHGYAHGNNLGVTFADASSKYIAILNNDVRVDKDWLWRLIEGLENDSGIGIAGCRVMSYWRTREVDSAGGYMDNLGMSYIRKDTATHLSDRPDVFFVFGSAFLMKRDLFDELGGFDDSFVLLHEEVDLCWRVWLSGHRVAYFDNSIVYHLAGGTTRNTRKDLLEYHQFKNILATLIKNYQLHNLALWGPMFVGLSAFRSGILVLQGRRPSALAHLKALGWNFIHLGETLDKRRAIQASRRMQDSDLAMMDLIIKPKLMEKLHGETYL
jgi:GT2 family glycosyltransferase